MKPAVFAIILNWNGKKNTLACLDSLRKTKQDTVDVSIVVVDNASKDDSIQAVRKQYPDVQIIKNQENLGFAEGMNCGIRYALPNAADYILILNNDIEVDEDLFTELLKAAQMNNTVGIVSPKIYFYPGTEFHKERYQKKDLGNVLWYAGGVMDWNNVLATHKGVDEVDHGQYDQIDRLDFASGCAMLIKQEVFQTVGLFDKKYFLYYEDNDISIRAIQKGFSILYAPKAKLWHKNAASAGGSGSDLQDYYITRNRMLFGMKYAPLRSKIALARESIKLLKTGRPWQKKGIHDYYLQKFGKGSWK